MAKYKRKILVKKILIYIFRVIFLFLMLNFIINLDLSKYIERPELIIVEGISSIYTNVEGTNFLVLAKLMYILSVIFITFLNTIFLLFNINNNFDYFIKIKSGNKIKYIYNKVKLISKSMIVDILIFSIAMILSIQYNYITISKLDLFLVEYIRLIILYITALLMIGLCIKRKEKLLLLVFFSIITLSTIGMMNIVYELIILALIIIISGVYILYIED